MPIVLPLFLTPITPSLYLIKLLIHVQLGRGQTHQTSLTIILLKIKGERSIIQGMIIEKDFLVIGSGIAGLTFALKASQFGSVAIVSKNELDESATLYAQGGIASVMTDDDSFELHADDTIESGRGLCREDVVRIICREGPSHVRELIDLGVKFTRIRGEDYHLSREGGHSRDRILHANDLTGREIERAMLELSLIHI